MNGNDGINPERGFESRYTTEMGRGDGTGASGDVGSSTPDRGGGEGVVPLSFLTPGIRIPSTYTPPHPCSTPHSTTLVPLIPPCLPISPSTRPPAVKRARHGQPQRLTPPPSWLPCGLGCGLRSLRARHGRARAHPPPIRYLRRQTIRHEPGTRGKPTSPQHTPSSFPTPHPQVASNIFDQTPIVFAQDLRKGRYNKIVSNDPRVLATIRQLGLPTDPSAHASAGVSLLPRDTVQLLLRDRRRMDLVEPFRLAILKLTAQEAARLMASAQYEASLPVALEAVEQGQDLFPGAAMMEMFPLYLLAAQANLGLRRAKQCEDFLSLASQLAVGDPSRVTPIMSCHLNRLYGQLYVLEGRLEEALEAFAEDVYYASMQYGPNDVRTSLGYYNLGKVFHKLDERDRSLSCNDQAVTIWVDTLRSVVMGHASVLAPRAVARRSLPLKDTQLLEVMDMLRDIMGTHQDMLGREHPRSGDIYFVLGLCAMYLQQWDVAGAHLQEGIKIFTGAKEEEPAAVVKEALGMVATKSVLPRSPAPSDIEDLVVA